MELVPIKTVHGEEKVWRILEGLITLILWPEDEEFSARHISSSIPPAA